MPELPEVETIRRGLSRPIIGQSIKAVEVLEPKSFALDLPTIKKLLLGRKVQAVDRRGKVLIIHLEQKLSLLIHLKMTGQLIFIAKEGKRFGGGHPTKSMQGDLPDGSTRVIFEFTSGDRLFFNDQRKFGWIKLVPTSEVLLDKLLSKMGPEPLSELFVYADFAERIGKRNAPIKAVLLDQSVLAGLGNIYVDEALHLAKIYPKVLSSKLKPAATKRLYEAIKAVLKLSVEAGGTSFTSYVNVLGVRGDYLKKARVFKRQGKLCPECGTEIIKIRVAGRGTHICPQCQKA